MDPVVVETIRRIWTLSLVAFGVVLVVVAALLTLILRAAKQIRAGVAEIWNVGQRVANNTVHVALLDGTNHVAARILASAAGVAAATGAIRAHAEACPRCPDCAAAPGALR